jgi:hypothetical protein
LARYYGLVNVFTNRQIKMLNINIDKLGITASTLCALHCAIVPLTLTLLPLWGLGFLANNIAEIGIVTFSLIIGVWSMFSSYKKHHHKLLPIAILITGFITIGLGHLFDIDTLESIFVPIGGLTVAFAHYLNMRLIKTHPA